MTYFCSYFISWRTFFTCFKQKSNNHWDTQCALTFFLSISQSSVHTYKIYISLKHDIRKWFFTTVRRIYNLIRHGHEPHCWPFLVWWLLLLDFNVICSILLLSLFPVDTLHPSFQFLLIKFETPLQLTSPLAPSLPMSNGRSHLQRLSASLCFFVLVFSYNWGV